MTLTMKMIQRQGKIDIFGILISNPARLKQILCSFLLMKIRFLAPCDLANNQVQPIPEKTCFQQRDKGNKLTLIFTTIPI